MASRGGGRALVLGHSSCNAALSQQKPNVCLQPWTNSEPSAKGPVLALPPLETPMYVLVVVVVIPQRRNLTACHAARGPHTSATDWARAWEKFFFLVFLFHLFSN